ncbi:unnamed protein product [Lymnaea stagnalis]|uniref:Doublecortin domain-containing protein n=1 Tax=Lymnaea stagnalis TaxID=6523 RepID=A0AAV2HX19_LYMST
MESEPKPRGRYSDSDKSAEMNHHELNNSTDHSDHGDVKYLNDMSRGRAANFYVNGDVFFPAKRVVYNPKHFKDMSHYLDYLTDRIDPRFGAVRKIHTPRQGHRITDLKDIQENANYVVSGMERFKPYSYDQITSTDRKKAPPFKYDVDPVYHNRQYLSSGKINKIDTHATLIKVWPNGDDLRGPRRVLLTARVRPYTLENVMAQVNEMLKEDCLGTVEKLYMLNGIKVSDIDQIAANGQYVACRKTERFKKARYTDNAVRNLANSPRLERKLLAPLYLRSNNSTNQSSPEHSNDSTLNSVNSYPQRRKAPVRNEETVFPAKPVKYTRSSEKVNNVDFDKDQGGVFKAKQSNRTTHGAREVPDTRHTRIEYPIDQQRAREVDEEDIFGTPPARTQSSSLDLDNEFGGPVKGPHNPKEEKIKTKDTKKDAPQKLPPKTSEPKSNSKRSPVTDRHNDKDDDDDDVRAQSAAKIQAGYRGYKTRQELASTQSPKKTPKRNNQHSPVDLANKEEKAAAKIQAGYRGYQTRKKISEERNQKPKKDNVDKKKPESQSKPKSKSEKPGNAADDEERAAAKIQAGFRGLQTRREISARKEDMAAAKIQAGFRGYQTRKQLANERKAVSNPKPAEKKKDAPKKEIRRDDDDDEQEWAAAKIQASYRGYQTRRELSKRQENAHQKSTSRDEEQAAARIQAGYRGYRERKTADKRTQEEQAAARIQAGYRGHAARRELNRSKKQTEEDKAAAKIQSGFRGYQSRKTLARSKPDRDEDVVKNASAAKIQAGYRGYRERKTADKYTQEEQAAARIQAGYRGYRERKTADKHSHEQQAAARIQAGYRGYRERKTADKHTQEEQAAARIQAGYRGYRERKTADKHSHEEQAAAKIQAGYRGYRTRKALNSDQSIAEREIAYKSITEKERASTKIQASYRGYRSRKELKRRRTAALKIQSGYRGYKERRSLGRHGATDRAEPRDRSEREQAAMKIQSSYRGYVARRQGRSNQSEARGKPSKDDHVTNDERSRAALTIQSNYRGYRDRNAR